MNIVTIQGAVGKRPRWQISSLAKSIHRRSEIEKKKEKIAAEHNKKHRCHLNKLNRFIIHHTNFN